MTMNPETYEEFQQQLEMQKKEQEKLEKEGPKIKVDEDGTEYEWDETKKAWFPKLSVELMMKYQSNYVCEESSDQKQQPNIHTDPRNGLEYTWNAERNRWEPTTLSNNTLDACRYTDPSGTIYVWNIECGRWQRDEDKKEGSSDDGNATNGAVADSGSLETMSKSENQQIYTDPLSGLVYTWDNVRRLWVSDDAKILYPTSSADERYTDETTGKVYVWDSTRQEWIPEKKPDQKKKSGKKRDSSTSNNKKASEATWFKPAEDKNTNVYVQGLPPDTDLAEFASIMSKCGIIMPNPRTGELKLKLYKDSTGNLKGDGLCCYLKKESLDLAIQLLDDTEVRGGYRIHVQKANFEQKGTYDPTKKPKMMSKKDKLKFQKEQEKLLDWKLTRQEKLKKSERVLIFKNMFDPKDFEVNAVLITEIRDDLRKECEKFGHVKKVIVFDRHPGGVCSVSFKDIDESMACLKAMDKRWFAERQINASVWDGVTDYQVEETDKEREERIKNWEDFLEADEETKDEKPPDAVNDEKDPQSTV